MCDRSVCPDDSGHAQRRLPGGWGRGRWSLRFGALLVALLGSAPVRPAVDLLPGAPESYTVGPADTLWTVASRFLRDPWRWREVWQDQGDPAHPSQLHPGDVLRLRRVDGQPRIRIERVGAPEIGHREGLPVVRLSPRVRESALKEAIPTIPILSIGPFLTQSTVVQSDQIDDAPYVVGFPDRRLVAGVGDKVYVRRIDRAEPGRFHILRPGEALHSPKTNELLGYLAIFVASAALERTGDPATLRVVRAEREVAIGDRVIPAPRDESLHNFFPRPAPAGVRARILQVLKGVTQVGQYDVVVIDAGSRERIEPGHLFEVFQGGGQELDRIRKGDDDWQRQGENLLSARSLDGDDESFRPWRQEDADDDAPLPPTVEVRRQRPDFIQPFERSGLLMVFRTFERVSFGIILNARKAMHVLDRLAPPPA